MHTYIAVKFPIYDAAKRIYAIGGIFTDISERKKLEESLKEVDKLFNMSIDIMVIASKDKFIKINPAMSRILGYSEQELLSNPFLTYVHPDDWVITKNEINKLEMGAYVIKFENRWICKDSSVKWLVWSASPDLSTGLLYAVAIDVTAQKTNEASLKIADTFFNMSFDMFVVIKNEKFVNNKKLDVSMNNTQNLLREKQNYENKNNANA